VNKCVHKSQGVKAVTKTSCCKLCYS